MNINKVIENIIKDYYDFFPKDNRLSNKNIYSIFRFLLYSFIIILLISDKYKLKLLLFIILFIFFISLILLEDKDDKSIKNILYEDEINKFKTITCRKSTINNPMSNILNTMDEQQLDMNICNENINNDKLIEDNLTYNLYSYSTDLYDRKTNKNKFISINNNNYPNNITDYKQFLYNFNDNNCKVDSMMCRS